MDDISLGQQDLNPQIANQQPGALNFRGCITSVMEDQVPKRHCWECRRRCLVCDFTEPSCRRCSSSGIPCPGYGDVRPPRLKWLAPGTVVSRKPRPKNTRAVENVLTTWTRRRPAIYTRTIDWDMPSLDTEQTAGCNLFQAAEYYNSCIFRDLAPALDLGRNPQIHDASPAQLQEALTIPDFIRLGLLCMTLSHRINQLGTRDIPQSKVLAERYYLCRGEALRSLSKQFDAEHNCTSDFVIGGVLTLLLLDIQSGAPPHWLYHLQGVRKLVDLRGGFRTLAATQSLAPLLHCLWFVGIITNTTCPRSHLETSAISHLEALDFMIEQYGSAMTPSQVWPPQLLAEVIKITHLRLQVTRKRTGSLERISEEAYEALDRIQGFSPEQLSESKASSREDWTCIGNVYKSAVALYCVLSLQSASVLPETPTLRASCAAHGQHLQHLLSTSLSSPRTRMFMFWPLILLGVEAVHGDATTRDFVSKHLLELSCVVGTSVPLTAQRVLASFWGSGDQSWDACFDRPYPFTTQIAVDIGRVYAPRQRDLRDL